MAGPPSWVRRTLRATQRADEVLREFGVPQDRAIDVYGVIEEMGLWLAFQPLTNVLGAALPAGEGGVLITTQREPAVQRYTAAHELGHWVLDRDWLEARSLAFDTELDILGSPAAERERLAQVFAASLLMPGRLLMTTLERLGVDTSNPGASDVYQAAREMQSSYEATLLQLFRLGYISSDRRNDLARTSKLRAKADLNCGRNPTNSRGDVWLVGGAAWNEQTLTVAANDDIVVSLPELPSTGYRWVEVDSESTVLAGAGGEGRPLPFPDQDQNEDVGNDPARLAFEANAERLWQRKRESAAAQRAVVALVGPQSVSARAPSGNPARVVQETPLPLVASVHVPADQVNEPWTRSSGREVQRRRLAKAPIQDRDAGGRGRRFMTFFAGRSGAWQINLAYRRRFEEADREVLRTFTLNARVEALRRGISLDQLAAEPGELDT